MNYALHAKAKFAQMMLAMGQHLMLCGPSGSGKSKFAHFESGRLGKTLQIIDCDGHLEVDDVLGGTKVVDGMWQQVDGALPVAAQNGHWLLINEFTTLKATVAHVFHSAANREPIPIRTDSGTRIITPAEDFRIIATMNGDGYAGNYRPSPATIDRFVLIDWPYPDLEDEIDILYDVAPNVSAGLLRELVTFARYTRTQNTDLRIPPITTRSLEVAAAMVGAGCDLETVAYHKLLLPIKMTAPEHYQGVRALIVGKLTGIDAVKLDLLERFAS